MPGYSLGVDIGGTFTDIVIVDHQSGQALQRKVLTTHGDPAEAVLAGVDGLLGEGPVDAAGIRRFVHATTLFTNALVERRGAATGLITTAGFRDSLEIGRERKYELYDLAIEKPAPLVPREWRLEVEERLLADGSVERPLDLADLEAKTKALIAEGVEALALCFLHAYRNPAHEQAAAAHLRATFPSLSITASHEVAPEIREFERGSTTVANAYVKPLADAYLARLAERAGDRGIAAPLLLMLSAGGLTHVAEARRTPVQMLESGPAAGALAAAHFGADDADGRLLAFDMGGTTAKLSLIDDGEPLTAYAFEAARQKRFMENSGLPILISTIELIEIGAGGGSLARTDALGLLKVGPESAGSEPGPAAYGRGGETATVTDADFVLGYLDPGSFADGSVPIDLDAARTALAGLAAATGLEPIRAAWGIHDVVNENMASAARVHIAERGRDPRGYALLCTGGAGPVHAYQVARKLGLRKLICPPAAGVASALGLLVAPGRVDRVATVGFRVDRDDPQALETVFARLEEEARGVLAETGLDTDTIRFDRLADGRFVGQGFNLVVDLPAGPYDGEPDAVRAALTASFETGYREKFARTPPDVAIEFINVRLSARAAVPGGETAALPTAREAAAPRSRRPAYFHEAGGFVETAVYGRADLAVGHAFEGPAIVEDSGSTLVIGPDGRAEVAASGNIIVHLPLRGEAEHDD